MAEKRKESEFNAASAATRSHGVGSERRLMEDKVKCGSGAGQERGRREWKQGGGRISVP